MLVYRKILMYNVLYNLAKGIGTMRPDQSDSSFSIKQMPLGLVEYIAHFFAAQTMYAHFGQKWVRLHHGPMWCTVLSTRIRRSL